MLILYLLFTLSYITNMIHRPLWPKQRHDFAQHALDVTQERLRRPEVHRAIGDYADILADLTHNELFVPHVTLRGEVEHPDEMADRFVFTAARDDERLHVSRTNMLSVQHVALRMNLQSSWKAQGVEYTQAQLDDSVDTCLIREDRPFREGFPKGHYGVCWMDSMKAPFLNITLRSRPTVFIGASRKQTDDMLAATTVHELCHAWDVIAQPIAPYVEPDVEKRRRELPAYSVESHFMRACGLTDEGLFPHRLEKIRQRYNGPLLGERAFVLSKELSEDIDIIL